MAKTIQQGAALLRGLPKQVKFAASLAINRTLDEIQYEQRRDIAQHFTLRRKTFIDRLVKRERTDFAKRDHLVGRVGIQGQGADILTKFEEGGTKTSTAGHAIALPVDVKLNKSQIVTKADRPRPARDKGAQVFTPHNDPNVRVIVKRTKARTRRVNGIAVGRTGGSRLLWALVDKVKIPALLGFYDNASRIATTRFVPNLKGAITRALTTAR